MPFFEYRCNDCEKKFEIFTLKNNYSASCSLCGSNRVHKVISPVGIVFKGTGFYINDSSKKSDRIKDEAKV